MIAFWLCFVPFLAMALLAALAEVAMRVWPIAECKLDGWEEWYD